jgi:hypothetical protein
MVNRLATLVKLPAEIGQRAGNPQSFVYVCNCAA